MPRINTMGFSSFSICGCCRRTTASYYNAVSALAVAGGRQENGTNIHSHVWQLQFFRDKTSNTEYTPNTRILPGQQGLFELNQAEVETEWAGVVAPQALYVDLEEDVLSECDLVSLNAYDLGSSPLGFGRDNFPCPQVQRQIYKDWLYDGGILCLHMLGYSGDPDDYTGDNPFDPDDDPFTYRDADLYTRSNSFIQFLGGNCRFMANQIKSQITFNQSLRLSLGTQTTGFNADACGVSGGIAAAYCQGQQVVGLQQLGQGWLIVAGVHAENLTVPWYINLLKGDIL